MKLIFIHGAPAVGKLTVARELASLTGLRLFHNHLTVDLLSAVFDFGSEPFVVLREHIWLSVFREAALNNRSLIFTFNPEGTVRERFIGDTIDVVEKSGGQLVFVELTCSQEELERRIENPSRSEFGKLGSVQQYRELKQAGAFNFPQLPKGLSLDTSSGPPIQTARLIVEYLSSI